MKKFLSILFLFTFLFFDYAYGTNPKQEELFNNRYYERFLLKEHNEYEKQTYYKLTNSFSTKNTDLEYALFNIVIVEEKNKNNIYIVLATMAKNNPPKIYDCSVYINKQKQELKFQALGEEINIITNSNSSEYYECLVCNDIGNLLEKIISAQEVCFQLKSHRRKLTDFQRETTYTFKLSEEQFYNIKKFYNDVAKIK